MDYDLFKFVGAIAGIGGIALASVVYIYKEIIRKNIFTKFDGKQGYDLLSKMVVLVFVIGVLGIIAYVVVTWIQYSKQNTSPPNINTGQLPSPTLPANNVSNIPPSVLTQPTSNNNISNVQTTLLTQATPNINSNIQEVVTATATPVAFVISSRVFDKEIPLEGARVSLVDLPEKGVVKTDNNGSFIFEEVTKKLNETIRIRVEHEGFRTEEIKVTIGKPVDMIYLEKTE